MKNLTLKLCYVLSVQACEFYRLSAGNLKCICYCIIELYCVFCYCYLLLMFVFVHERLS